jgi:AraC-like DNA-binding protein
VISQLARGRDLDGVFDSREASPRQSSKSPGGFSRGGEKQRVLAMIESGVVFNISDLATRLHASRAQLQRLFKRETGTRISEWLIAQKLQKAAYLLANSYLSVKEIARSAGYEHVSSFIRAFERRYALTPKRYRERAEATDVDSGGGSVA